MSTFVALALLALSVWLAPRVRDWLLKFHDRDACPVCQRNRQR